MSRIGRAFPVAATSLLVLAAWPAHAQETRIDTGTTQGLALTLYQGGLGFVEDVRRARLAKGRNIVAFEGVSSDMDPESVRLDVGAGARVGSVNLETALLTPKALLERAIGKQIGVVRINPKTGEETTRQATVLSVAGGQPVLEVGGKVETGVSGPFVFPAAPKDLHPRPTLTAEIDADRAQDSLLSLDYLSGGLGWQADYTATLAPDGRSLELAAWATLKNGTDASFIDAETSLVAGEVKAGEAAPGRPSTFKAAAALASPSPMPERSRLDAFHLYRLRGRVSLHAHQSKQVALFDSVSVPFERTLVYRSSPPVWATLSGPSLPSHPEVRIGFVNRGGERRLPAGAVRVYGPDQDGRLRFLGQDHIGDVPPGGPVQLALGRAFDVTVSRTQTAFHRLGAQSTDSAYELDVVNGGEKAASVRLIETLPGDWKILKESEKHRREGGTAVWTVSVPPNGSTTLTYEVRING